MFSLQVEVQNQAKAREEFKRSITANEREQLRKLQAKKREQEESAVMLRQAIALREKQDKVLATALRLHSIRVILHLPRCQGHHRADRINLTALFRLGQWCGLVRALTCDFGIK